MHDHEAHTLRLQPGQPQSVWMERDTHVLVERGGVAITLPPEGWFSLGLSMTVTVSAGSAQALPRAGWLRLEALGPRSAQVRLLGERPLGHPGRGPLSVPGGDAPEGGQTQAT
ncbi:MAG TPA: hypothetical protein VGD46_10250 [Rhizobacter sp.]